MTAKVNLRKTVAKQAKTTIQVPDFEDADWSALRTVLLQAPLLQAIQGSSDVNAAWFVWHQVLQEAVSFIPVLYIKTKPNPNYG